MCANAMDALYGGDVTLSRNFYSEDRNATTATRLVQDMLGNPEESISLQRRFEALGIEDLSLRVDGDGVHVAQPIDDLHPFLDPQNKDRFR